MRAMKKGSYLEKKRCKPQKTLNIQKDLIGGNPENLLSMSENSYSIDCMKNSPFHEIKTRPNMNAIEFFSWTLALLRFNKNC